MKTLGIILLVIGIIAFIGAIAGASQGKADIINFTSPLIFVIIGAFLINRANKMNK